MGKAVRLTEPELQCSLGHGRDGERAITLASVSDARYTQLQYRIPP